MLLNALFKLGFPMAPDINSLTLQHKITRRLILQQARRHTINSAPACCKLTVLGSNFTQLLTVLFAFPSLYSFTIGHRLVFSLTSWSRRIQTGFHVPRLTRDSYKSYINFAYETITLCGVTSQLTLAINIFFDSLYNL